MHNVLVLGGYGFFGERICSALAKESSIKLYIAGRDRSKAIALAATLGLQPDQAIGVDAHSTEFTGRLVELGIDTLIHAAGPFQGQDYAVAPGVITGSHSDYAATGQAQTLSWSGSVSDQVAYTYDSFGNLNTQQRGTGGGSNTESYIYDSLQRLTNAKRAIGSAVSYSYSANGNITSKNDNGTGSYSYPPVNGRSNGCGPHAAISANGLSYTCDANGNVIGGAISATYDADNHPRSISRGGGAMSWSYSTSGAMTLEVSSRGLRYFGPNGYEQISTGSGATQVHELGPVIVTRTGGADSVSVVLRDRLGSTISVIDANAPTTRWYDAFGKVRKGDMTDKPPGTLNLNETIHGFTKHDHADDVQLIHMGGRVYDYNLGRFLQVDPVIGNPHSSQGLNPYSYIGNNPLSGVDPTGYQCKAGTMMAADNSGCVGTAERIDGFSVSYQFVQTDSGATKTNASGSGGNAPSQQTSGTPTGSTPTTQSGQPAPNAGCQIPLQCAGGGSGTAGTQVNFFAGDHQDNGSFNKGIGLALWDTAVTWGSAMMDFDGNGALPSQGPGDKFLTQKGYQFGSILPAAIPFIGPESRVAPALAETIPELETVTVTATAVKNLRAAGLKDAHHVIQDAAVRDLPGYNSGLAPGVQLRGPSTQVGTPHYLATQVQRQAGGGTYSAERRIGYKALRVAGMSESDARSVIDQVDAYFQSIGVTPSTATRVPGNRN